MAQAAVNGRLSASAPRLATNSANLMNFALFTSLMPTTAAAANQPPTPRAEPGRLPAESGTLGTEAVGRATATSPDITSLACSLIPPLAPSAPPNARVERLSFCCPKGVSSSSPAAGTNDINHLLGQSVLLSLGLAAWGSAGEALSAIWN